MVHYPRLLGTAMLSIDVKAPKHEHILHRRPSDEYEVGSIAFPLIFSPVSPVSLEVKDAIRGCVAAGKRGLDEQEKRRGGTGFTY